MRSTYGRLGVATKYHNQPVMLEGVRFASRAEGSRYMALTLQQHAGLISALILQPRFLLLPAREYDDRRERAIYYVADFGYFENGQAVVEEVKGYSKNPVWRLKRRLFLQNYPEYELRIIKV